MVEIFKEDKKFMKMALEEAKMASSKGEVPVGSIIVKDRKVVGKGHNLKETLFDATAHAEILAIRQACENLRAWRLVDCTLYTTLEPCPMCAGAIVIARIRRVVFAAHDPKSGAACSLLDILRNEKLNHQVEVVGGFMEEESKRLLTPFFQKLRQEG